MKSFLLSTLIITLTFSQLQSQDWSLFPLGQTSYFDVNEYILFADNYGVEKFTNDTSIQKGDTTFYYFDTKIEDYISCLDNEDFLSEFIWNNGNNMLRPDSFYTLNDTMYYIKFGDTYKVPTISIIGDTIFRHSEDVFVTYDSIYQDTYLNFTDSFRNYTINYIINGVTYKENALTLSKNHGIILFVQFMEGIMSPSDYHYSKLRGYTNNQNSGGIVALDFDEFFHLSVGDELVWEYYYDDWITYGVYNLFYRYKDEIISITDSSDSLIYHCTRTYFDSTINVDVVYCKSDMHKAITLPSQFGTDKFYTNQSYYSWAPYVYCSRYHSNEGIVKAYFSSGTQMNFQDCEIYEIIGGSAGFALNTKVGLSQFSKGSCNSDELTKVVGGMIDGVEFGSTEIFGITEIVNQSHISIYPNPFTTKANVKLIDNSDIIIGYDIHNIAGQLIFEESDLNTNEVVIDRIDLKSGLYIMTVYTLKSKAFSSKLVIQD